MRLTRRAILRGVCAAPLVARAAHAAPRAPSEGDAGAPRIPVPEQELARLLEAFVARRRAVSSMRAHFTQVRTLRLFAAAVRSHGRVAFASPDKFRWELRAPDAAIYLAVGNKLVMKAGTAAPIVTKAAAQGPGQGLADLRSLLVSDLRELRKRFSLSAFRAPGEVILRGVARAKKPKLASFELTTSSDLKTPRRARLEERVGDHVDIVFSKVETNVPLPANLFAL